MSIILKNKDGVLLKTAGKYCPEDIIVVPQLQEKTVTSNGKETPDANYAGLSEVTVNVPETPTQEKTITITENGTQEVVPDSGNVLSKVTVTTNVPSGSNLNVHYGNTAPEDTSKLWVKSTEPESIEFIQDPEQQVQGLSLLDEFLPTAARGIAAAAVGTKIYLFGGSGSDFLNAIQEFDTETKTRTTLSATLPTAASDIAAAAVGTKIYLFGGSNSSGRVNTIQEFDTETKTIQTLSATLPTAANDIAAAAVGTKIYLFGGSNSSGRVNTIQEFIVTFVLTMDNILGQQDYNKNIFTLVQSPTKVTIGLKNVYKGNSSSIAEFVDAYLYDGTNWVNVNTGETA